MSGEWESGVLGSECNTCERITIVRVDTEDEIGVPTSWICRPCAFGDDLEDFDDEEWSS